MSLKILAILTAVILPFSSFAQDVGIPSQACLKDPYSKECTKSKKKKPKECKDRVNGVCDWRDDV